MISALSGAAHGAIIYSRHGYDLVAIGFRCIFAFQRVGTGWEYASLVGKYHHSLIGHCIDGVSLLMFVLGTPHSS